MTGHRILLAWVLLSLITALASEEVAAVENRTCQEVKEVLENKRKQLAEYLTSLEKSQPEGDAAWLAVLNRRIIALLNEIVDLPELADCQHRRGPVTIQVPSGMGPIKADANEHFGKTCSELKKMLVQLVRKASSLKRREHSTFSELSEAEMQDLQDARREIRVVVEIMKARCGLSSTAKPGKSGQGRQQNPRGLRPAQ
jgi:hypothetical protein